MFKKMMELGVFGVQNMIKFGILIFTLGASWAAFNSRIDAMEKRSLINEDRVMQLDNKLDERTGQMQDVLCEIAIDVVPDKKNTKKYCKRN